jgi:F-type H+-transporting ATPase subunit delta
MQNPRLASRYAKSLIGLAMEQQQLEPVLKDMEFIQAVCKSNRDVVNLLRSPVIKGGIKQKVFAAVTAGRIGELSQAFTRLLINKGREGYLPEIAGAYIRQYKEYKGIRTVKLTTASPVSDEIKKEILSKIGADTGLVELETVVDENIIGGFMMQTGDQLVDASIAYDLRAIKKQFMNNDFIYKVR